MDEDNVAFVKPGPKKCNRRSSFFLRRSLSSFSSDSPSGPGFRATLLPVEGDADSARTKEDIKNEYLSKLKKENEDWKDLVDQKRKQVEELREKCPQAASSADFLTEEDKKLLADRPDYKAIGRLLDDVTEAIAIRGRRICGTMDKVTSVVTRCEDVTDELAGRVIKHFMEGFSEFDDDVEDFNGFVDVTPAS